MASREATLVDGALLDRGQMSAGRPAAVRQQPRPTGSCSSSEALALLTPSLRAGYAAIDNSPAYQQFQAMESQIMASTGSGPSR